MKQYINISRFEKDQLSEFEKLFKSLYPRLMSLGSRFLPNEIVEDFVQDVFSMYWIEREKLELNNVESYLFKSLQNKCLNYIQHKDVEKKYISSQRIAQARLDYYEHNTEEDRLLNSISTQEFKEQLEAEIEKLPIRMAEAFRLCYIEDLSHKEISKIMNISTRTVEVHIYKALERIRENINPANLLAYLISVNFF